MKVSTTSIGAEMAMDFFEPTKDGLRLKGIICPQIDFKILGDIIHESNFIDQGLKIIIGERSLNFFLNHKDDYDWIINILENDVNEFRDILEKRLFTHWLVIENSFNIPLEVRAIKEDIIPGRIESENIYGIHMNLLVYDNGFVLSSANITDSGINFRGREMGIYINREDNDLEVDVVNRLLNAYWTGRFVSCTMIRNEIRANQ